MSRNITTREDLFDYQAEQILIDALKHEDIENVDDIEKFTDELWEQDMALEIGRQFLDRLRSYSGDEVFQKAMEEYAENIREDEE
jgi:hypothetical protein